MPIFSLITDRPKEAATPLTTPDHDTTAISRTPRRRIRRGVDHYYSPEEGR